jgi:hypothetical protein
VRNKRIKKKGPNKKAGQKAKKKKKGGKCTTLTTWLASEIPLLFCENGQRDPKGSSGERYTRE